MFLCRCSGICLSMKTLLHSETISTVYDINALYIITIFISWKIVFLYRICLTYTTYSENSDSASLMPTTCCVFDMLQDVVPGFFICEYHSILAFKSLRHLTDHAVPADKQHLRPELLFHLMPDPAGTFRSGDHSIRRVCHITDLPQVFHLAADGLAVISPQSMDRTD